MANIFADQLNFAIQVSPGFELWYGDNLEQCLSKAGELGIDIAPCFAALHTAKAQIRPNKLSPIPHQNQFILKPKICILQRRAKNRWVSFKWYPLERQAMDHLWMRLTRIGVLNGHLLQDALAIGREQALRVVEEAVVRGATWSAFGLGEPKRHKNTLLEGTLPYKRSTYIAA